MQTPAQTEYNIHVIPKLLRKYTTAIVSLLPSLPETIPPPLFPTPSQSNALLGKGVIFSSETAISHSTCITAGKAPAGQVLQEGSET